MNIEELNLNMKKRVSEPYRPRAVTDRKSVNGSGNTGSKFMAARAGSFKDAPITKYIYYEDTKSEDHNRSSKGSK